MTILRSKGGFAKNFGTYASNNTAPVAWYPEGASWPSAPMTRSHVLQESMKTTDPVTLKVNHMAARNVRISPAAAFAGPRWAVRIVIDAPSSVSTPVVMVQTTGTDGSRGRQRIALSDSGAGTGVFSFDATSVASVTLTLANASTRFTCWQGTSASCMGDPRDENKNFTYKATAFLRPAL